VGKKNTRIATVAAELNSMLVLRNRRKSHTDAFPRVGVGPPERLSITVVLANVGQDFVREVWD